MKIMAPPSATRETVVANVKKRTGVHPRFLGEMFPALWQAAVARGVDPVGVVAQAGKETGWGNYTGNVKPEFYNTAGLKLRHPGLFPGVTDGDKPLAHSQFPSWLVGATAHVQHLRAYAGVPIEFELIVDPRYVFIPATLKLTDFSELGGRWAPSPTYGTELEALMKALSA